MKKIFTILGVSAAVFASAQASLFNGSNFNNWATFTGSLDSNGLKYAAQGVGTGVNGTDCLNINSSNATANAYVFTVNSALSTTGITAITLKVKGNSGGISFNVGNKFFNVPAGTTSDVTLDASGSNLYTGSIAAADWITITLNMTGVTFGATGPFSVKVQKTTSPNLLIDDIVAVGVLAVGDVNATKVNLVKNTIVANDIIFGEAAKVSIVNMAGQVVKTAEVAKDAKLNVSELVKGTYVVTATVNGKAVSQKIVKK